MPISPQWFFDTEVKNGRGKGVLGNLPITPIPDEYSTEDRLQRQQTLASWKAFSTMSSVSIPSLPTIPAIQEPDPRFLDVPTLVLPAIKTIRADVATQETKESVWTVLKQLFKSSGIYTIATMAVPLGSLFLSTVLTRVLSEHDYGALVTLNAAIILITGITQMGMAHAFVPVYTCDYENPRDRRAVISTVTIMLCLTSLPVAILLWFCAPSIATVFLGNPVYTRSVRIALLTIVLQNFTVPGFSWLRAHNRPLIFTILALLTLSLTVALSYVWMIILPWGMEGALWATAAGYAFGVFVTLPFVFIKAGWVFRQEMAKSLLILGFPHIINLLAGWTLQLADRYILSLFTSFDRVAEYAVAYNLGSVLTIIVSAFTLAWSALMFPLAKREDAAKIFQLVFRYYGQTMLWATFLFACLAELALHLFFPPMYEGATVIMPIVLVATMFNGLFVVLAVGPSVLRQTWVIAICITIAALINIGLNILMIPLLGLVGAAWATLIAYFALAVLTYLVNQYLYPVPFEIGRFLIAFVIGVVLYLWGSELATQQDPIWAWITRIGLLIIYAGVLLGNNVIANSCRAWWIKMRGSGKRKKAYADA